MIELLTIYTLSADGSTYGEFLVDGSPVEISEYSYVAERMGTTSLSGTVKHHRCLDALWTGREFVVLDEGELLQSGVSAVEKFFLLHVPSSRKDNTDERYEHTLDFRSARDILLSGVYFCDAVNPGASSAGKPVNNGYDVKFVGTLDEFVQRFNDVLAYRGLSSRFSVSLEAGVQGTTESLEIAFDRATLADALARAYEVWGVPYYFVGDSAVFGSADSSPLVGVEYGHDKELLSVSMNNRGDKIVTRIAGEGGTENVPYYYPNPTPKGALALGGTFAAGASIRDALLFAQRVGTSDVLTYEGKDAAFGFIEVHFGGRTGHNAEGGVTAVVEDVEMVSGTEYPLWVGVGADLSGGFDRSLRIPLYANVGCEEQVDPDTLLYYVTSHDPTGSYGGTYSFLTRRWGDVSAKGWDIVVDRAEAVFGSGANAVTVPVKWTEDYAEREVSPEDAELYNALALSGVSVDLGAVIAQLPAGTDLQHVYVHVFGHVASKVKWQVAGMAGFDPAGFLAERVSAVSAFDPCGWYLGDESFGEDLSELGLTVTGTPQEGDTLTQVVSLYVTPTGRIMPSVYRDSHGALRSYDADNTPPSAYAQAYVNPDTGQNYDFEHEYDALEPHEHVERFDDVTPSIKNLQDGQGHALNVLDSVWFDDGYNVRDLLPDGQTLKYQYFFVKLKALGFNLFDCAIENGEMALVMSDGPCAGCHFKILVTEDGKNPVQRNANGTLKKEGASGHQKGVIDAGNIQAAQQDTTANAVWVALYLDDQTFGGGEYGTMPAYDKNTNSGPKPAAGDSYTAENILLPQAFFTAAEQELDRRLVRFMWEHNADKFDPSVIFSRVYLAQHPTVREGLSERSRLSLTYAGRTFAPLYVSQFTMNVKKGEALPEILVETADAVEPRTAGLEDRIDDAVGKAVGVVRPATGGVDLSEADKRYLRKDDEDTAKGKIVFEKGFEVGPFQSGREGSGGAIYSNAAGEALAEVDYLLVRRKATFTQLEVEALRKVNGTILLSMADAVLTAVEQTNSGWKCWFKTAAEDGSAVENGFAAGDQAICRTLRSNKDHYYWRLVTAVGPDWIELSASDADTGSDAPEVGDTVVQLGNRSDSARQAAQIMSCYGTDSPSYVIYAGINSYALAGKEISGFVYRESTPGSGTYRPHFFNYGSMLLGDPSGDRVTFTPASGATPGVLEVRGRVIVQGSEGGDVDLTYLTTALPLDEDATIVQGGIILSRTIALTDAQGNVKAGISGMTSLGNIAAWYGGPMVDREAVPLASDYAKALFRFDGSGYLAGGNIHWDDDGYGGIPGVTWSREGGQDVITIGGGVRLASVDGDTVTDLLTAIQLLPTTYVDFLSNQTITGVKTFTNGIKIGDATLTWHPESYEGAGDGYLHVDSALVTAGDQIVQNGTPGGGGGGGGSEYLWELLDVDDNLQSPAAGALLQYDSVAGLWKGNAPATHIGVGVTGFTTGALIRNVLGDDFNAQWSVKQFINSSIATSTATFRGTNTTATTEAAFLTWANALTHDLNDYVFWKTSDSLGNVVYKRYKYDGSQWVFEYELNNSSFTAEQWDAINSGITSGKVGTYDTIAGYFSGGKILSTALPAMYIGKTAVQFTSATQDLTGIGNVTLDNAKYLRAYNSAGDTLYNLVWLTSSNYGYFGAANSPRTYMRGQSLYFLSGDSGNTSALAISTTQNATFYGSIYLQNGKQIYGKSTADTGGVSLSLLNLSASNVLLIGSGLIATGTSARAYNTYIYGASVSFYTGNSTNGSSRKWMINSSGNLYPYADKSYNLGAAQNYVKEAYIGKMFLAPGVYIEYVPASGDTPGYVHISSHLLTDGDQIVKEGVPGGGGGGGSEYLWELEDVDNALITPSNGVVLQYNATAGKWKGVASDTIGITTAGTVAELNAANPTTAKRVWSPSVLASWLAGKGFLTSAVTNIAVGGSGHTGELAITKNGATSYLTVPYATNVVRFKRYDGTLDVQGGYDLNTLLSGGGITSQYNSMYTWGNGPTGMSFGGAVQLNPFVGQTLAMQLAWDIDHTNVKTGHLWWRDSIYKNSTHTWGEWHLIYDDTTLTKSVITGLLDDGNGTYVKLNPGSAEQTISSNISSLEKGVVNLWRKSGDHFTFLGFSNGTTETYLGGIGFKSQSDHNLYRKDGSNYYKIWDEANSNLASVNWACNALSAAGHITLANNKCIRWMSNPEGGASPEAIIAIEFTTDNNLYIGYGVAVSGHNTRLYGNNIYFLTGSATRTTAFALSDSNATMYRTFVPSINNRYDLGSSELKWGTLHANNGNFYNKVNIGSPSFSDGALNVNGAIVSSGDQVVTSDIRVKRNIKPIELTVEQIASCRAVTFDWASGGHSFGSIAQDWEPILPEAVKDGDIKALAYGQLGSVIGIKVSQRLLIDEDKILKLQKHETAQDKEIRVLKDALGKANGRIEALEKEVKRLRA